MKFNRYISFILACLMLAISMGGHFSTPATQTSQPDFSELGKILGEKIVICTNSNTGKYFYTSFERLSDEKNQKLKSFAELKKHSPNTDTQHNIIYSTAYSVAANISSFGAIASSEGAKPLNLLACNHLRAPPAIS